MTSVDILVISGILGGDILVLNGIFEYKSFVNKHGTIWIGFQDHCAILLQYSCGTIWICFQDHVSLILGSIALVLFGIINVF